MKKIILLTLLCIMAAFTFAACDIPFDIPFFGEHEHTFGEYQGYESGHFREYTCGHATPEIMEMHSDENGDGYCDLCSYKLKSPDDGTTDTTPDDGSTDATEPEPETDPFADGLINIEELRGKIVVVNFWGTWCGPCKAELPHFDEVAEEYADEVTILAVHSVANSKEAAGYIKSNFPDSRIIFAYDVLLNQDKPSAGDRYFKLLGGSSYYPRTVVLNSDGVITFATNGMITKDQLLSAIDSAKEYTTPESPTKGNDIGDLCHAMDLEIIKTKIAASEGLEYEINSLGTFYGVKSIGSCTDTDIRIPETYQGLPVAYVMENAFADNTDIISVTLPDCMGVIYTGAFSSCTSLQSVTMGDNIKSIYEYAFAGCISLSEINLSASLESIYGNAFHNCKSLTEITIPASVVRVIRAFEYCTALKSVIFENTDCWTTDYQYTYLEGLDDPALAAKYLTDTYAGKLWFRDSEAQ